MKRARVLRAIVQKDPGLENLLKTPEQETGAPRLQLGAVARRIREHRGLGSRHDGTVDTPAAESEPPEDHDIYRAKSPTPAPETFIRAESIPPPPTPSHSATTAPAPTPRVPDDTTNPHPAQQIAAGGSQDTLPPNATNTAQPPSPKSHNKPGPPTHTALRRGRACGGHHRTLTSTFLPLPDYFLHTTPKIPDYIYTLPRRPLFSYLLVSAKDFLDVSYALHFRVPIPCIIVINSLYPLTLASGIRYF